MVGWLFQRTDWYERFRYLKKKNNWTFIQSTVLLFYPPMLLITFFNLFFSFYIHFFLRFPPTPYDFILIVFSACNTMSERWPEPRSLQINVWIFSECISVSLVAMYHECDIVFPLFFYFSLLPFILFLVRVNQLAMKLLLLFFFLIITIVIIIIFLISPRFLHSSTPHWYIKNCTCVFSAECLSRSIYVCFQRLAALEVYTEAYSHFFVCHQKPHKIRESVLILFHSLFIAELESLCREFHKRIEGLEGDKWDLEHQIKMKDYQVTGAWPGRHGASLDSARLAAGASGLAVAVLVVAASLSCLGHCLSQVSCSNSFSLQAVSYGGPHVIHT